MAKAVKKPAPKNARGNKTRTKKPAVAKKAPLAQKPVAAARTARSSGTAARPKQAARPARPPAEEGPKAGARAGTRPPGAGDAEAGADQALEPGTGSGGTAHGGAQPAGRPGTPRSARPARLPGAGADPGIRRRSASFGTGAGRADLWRPLAGLPRSHPDRK